jgi:hypothetical protein
MGVLEASWELSRLSCGSSRQKPRSTYSSPGRSDAGYGIIILLVVVGQEAEVLRFVFTECRVCAPATPGPVGGHCARLRAARIARILCGPDLRRYARSLIMQAMR